ncbi:hypothetical protein [Neorhizobium galegae]|uniref:Uncharacterized protein n=1 Tax=Neorhizobium galegae bv. orientalis str. HAMBI 540 TaxID=1028800 RepID=A0A068T243_NEOGA|nr:hypothetical protein [Neorhizobium galegae]CDN51565.1 Hypothetical protein RG540_PA08890 [Neorhizobium galegae bv. orientalis str. HAMBI 540]CDZ54289.1 Hypothetical protein NGAL_HAMBI2427_55790 [Neorhizobium galegae bv. orientalis]
MPSFLDTTPEKLNRIIGTSGPQTLIDVRCRQGRKLSRGVFAYRLSLEWLP